MTTSGAQENIGLACKSFLFVPGHKPERFEKAIASGADAVIIDLEDAVPFESKVKARDAIARFVSLDRSILLRINAVDSPFFEEDMNVARRAGIAGIVVPKAESARDIASVVEHLRVKVPVFPLIETAKGMWDALSIAASPGVQQLIFGTLDFILDVGMMSDGVELNSFRSQLVLVSRVAGIAGPIDGVTTSIEDFERLIFETQNGRRLGCAGKLCIHPRQVATVNACYQPSEDELNWAHAIVKAADRAHGGAVTVDGLMVDRPVVQRAMRLISLAKVAARLNLSKV